jgi:hypothetical protein
MAAQKLKAEPKGPFKLVTVNTAPERAAKLIGRMVEALKEQYTIIHVANVTGITIPRRTSFEDPANSFPPEIKDVKPTVEKFNPDMLVSILLTEQRTVANNLQFCASMWTPEESAEIQAIARSIVPGIKTHAIPQGLQVQKGPDAIVEYLLEKVPGLIDSSTEFQKAVTGFRKHLPDLNTPRFQIAKEQSPYEYVEAFQKNKQPPWIYGLTEAWRTLLEEPYKGVTSDGE